MSSVMSNVLSAKTLSCVINNILIIVQHFTTFCLQNNKDSVRKLLTPFMIFVNFMTGFHKFFYAVKKIIFSVQKLFLLNFCRTIITFTKIYKSHCNAIFKIFISKISQFRFSQKNFFLKFYKKNKKNKPEGLKKFYVNIRPKVFFQIKLAISEIKIVSK